MMRLNDLFSPKNKKAPPEYFLAVEIHESLIKTAVWQIEDETPTVVSLGSYELWDSEDSLVNGLDASLSEATKGLDIQPDRVILGLPASWLVDNKIHPSKQNLIKRIIKDLGLKPVGMVTIAEAIVSHFKDQEGVPPTAILLEIYPLKVVVTLINTGQLVATEEVGRSDDLARDVEEGLARMEVSKLPARFLLTNGSDLENESQQITSYPWSEKLPFLHLPKVQVLPIDFSIRAIALSGGVEVAKSLGLEVVPTKESESVASSSPEEVDTESIIETETDSDSDLGFVAESDLLVETEAEAVESETDPVPADDNLAELSESDNFVATDDADSEAVATEPSAKPKLSLPKIPKLPTLALPQFSLPKFNFSPKLSLIVLPLVLLLILGGLTGYYFFLGKVYITITVKPKRDTRSLDLAIATAAKPNTLTLVATPKTLSAKASDSAPTTGEAVVGDKASGRVSVYNLTAAPLSLKAGTKITSPTGLVYVLNAPLNVASRSADALPPFTITPGSAPVDVTAGKIGAEFNLDKNTQFSVDNYPKSNVIASADTALAGGTSRTVKAVSKTDQDKLLQSVAAKVRSQIADNLKNSDPNSRFLSVGDLTYSTKSFSNNVGEEASTVSLDLAGDQKALVYSYSDLLNLIQTEVLKNSNPGLTPVSNQTSITFSDPVAQTDGSFTTKAQADLVLLPEFDAASYTNIIKGKSADQVKQILEQINGFQSAVVVARPKLPILQKFMPLNPKNITLNLVSN